MYLVESYMTQSMYEKCLNIMSVTNDFIGESYLFKALWNNSTCTSAIQICTWIMQSKNLANWKKNFQYYFRRDRKSEPWFECVNQTKKSKMLLKVLVLYYVLRTNLATDPSEIFITAQNKYKERILAGNRNIDEVF